jgi:predicted amidohydrolase YtcJ
MFYRLSQDVLKIAPAAIRDTHVLKTFLGGVEIYDSPAASPPLPR